MTKVKTKSKLSEAELRLIRWLERAQIHLMKEKKGYNIGQWTKKRFRISSMWIDP